MAPRQAARVKQFIKLYIHSHGSRKVHQHRRFVRLKKWLHQTRSRASSTSHDSAHLSDSSGFSSSKYSGSRDNDSEPMVNSANSGTVGSECTVDSDPSSITNSLLRTTTNSNSNSSQWTHTASDNALSLADSDDSALEMLNNIHLASNLGVDSDEESAKEDEAGRHRLHSGRRICQWVLDQINEMYSARYLLPREPLPRGPSYLQHILMVLKNERADLFRQALRVSPATFDVLVNKISPDEVFANNSNNGQMPVEEQLAITLYRFGHDGNTASLQSVANWAGVGKGTVDIVTKRVMTALLWPLFMEEAVRFPTPAEKEEAKQWVEEHSCKAWRGGWCMVDGTLIPLADKPTWFGESYFDCKSRYSFNIQIVSLPNLRIIDFSYRHIGSTHDSTAWEETRLVQEHEELFSDGEWVWADSAYPINTWIIAPYKKPERDLPDNEVFNNHVSMVCIRSEHAIGFLKGRFHSLKNLRLHITSKKRHIFATYWIAACIAAHSFVMQCEELEREAEVSDDDWEDPFIAEGYNSDCTTDDDQSPPLSTTLRTSSARLIAAKACREKLKHRLFRAKEHRISKAAESRHMEL